MALTTPSTKTSPIISPTQSFTTAPTAEAPKTAETTERADTFSRDANVGYTEPHAHSSDEPLPEGDAKLAQDASALMKHQQLRASTRAPSQGRERTLGSSEEHHHHVHGKGKGSAKADLGDKLKYETSVMNSGNINKPLDPKLRTKDQLPHVHKQLDEQIAKEFPGGLTFKPPFKDPQGAEAADAKWAALNSIKRERGAHSDAVVNLNGKNNLVSADVDKKGAATVTIHGPGQPDIPKTSKFADEAAAKAALKKDFGVEVSDKPKKFSVDELNKAHAAFSTMSADEKKALKGVTLERHTSLGKNRSAEFDWSSKTDKSGKPSRKDVLRIGDSTFDGDKNSFVGSGKAGSAVPPSVAVIAHEAGHAVESQARRDGLYDHAQAKYDYNTSQKAHGQAVKDWGKAYSGLSGADKTAAGSVNKAVKDVELKMAALAGASPKQVDARRKDLEAAIQKRDAAISGLPAGHPAKANADTIQAAQDDRIKNKIDTIHTTKAELDAAQTSKKSTRLASFEKFVKDNKIPPFTDYAKSGGSAEFYAEAYSLYKTDPEWMKANSPLLYDYFQKNNHLQ